MTAPLTRLSAQEGDGNGVVKVPVWQRRRGLSIGILVLAILVITVLTDLPTGTSRASDVSAERSVMTEVNADLSSCALAVHQAVGIWTLQSAHKLTAADRAPTPGLLSDDQTACSLTNESIFDLANIEIPGTAAGKHLRQMAASALLWSTSDALQVIEDVATLMGNPNDPSVRADLTKSQAGLDADRAKAIAQERAADRALQTAPSARRHAGNRPELGGMTPASPSRHRPVATPRQRGRAATVFCPKEGNELGVGVILGLQPHEGVPEDHGHERHG